jgi:hypothetical protein
MRSIGVQARADVPSDSTPVGAAGNANPTRGAPAPWHDGWVHRRVTSGPQLRLPYGSPPRGGDAVVSVPGLRPAVVFVRHRRARQYVLRLRDDGVVKVTVPWRGSRAEAERFLLERRDWLAREQHRRAMAAGSRRAPWRSGTPVPVRGVEVPLEVTPAGGRFRVAFAGESFAVAPIEAGDLQGRVEAHLRRLAARELPSRLHELARAHGFAVKAVSVRNQRTRWGSCSPSGRISLNWRLIQVPPAVCDYVLLHELAHLRHLNHSARFWRELARLCPGHADARRWLRTSKLLAC